MNRKLPTSGITILLAVMMAVPAGANPYAGRINALNLANNKLTIGGRTYVVARDASIRLDGNSATLADLNAGMRVTAEVARDNTTILLINAHSGGPSLAGRVTGVDLSRDTVGIGGRTFRVPGDAEVKVDGREATVADLDPGMRVTAKTSMDGTTIHNLFAQRVAPAQAKIIGTVIAVNTVRDTLTIRTRNGGTQRVKVRRAMIDLDGRGVELFEVKPGMTVVIKQWSPGVIYVKSAPQLYARR